MDEFLRSYWLLNLGNWAFILLIGLGFGWWASSKGLSGLKAFRHGTLAAGLTFLGIELAIEASMSGPIWPLQDYKIELWYSLILPRIGLWSVIIGLITFAISGARSRHKAHSPA